MAVTVGKLPISMLVGLFFFYVIAHCGIAYLKQKLETKARVEKWIPETERNYKVVNFLFRWFPAIYVVFIVLILYF